MTLKGTDFEALVKPFFKSIFEKAGFIVLEVRNQTSGTQNGFDIKIVFNDSSNKKRNLFIECKYYTTRLNWAEIFKKQFELHGSNETIDGFILVSPKENLSNIDQNICVGVIQSISLSDDNYYKAKRMFAMYSLRFRAASLFRFNKRPAVILTNLNFYFENIEQKYYVMKSVNIDMQEALKKYAMVK